MDLFPLLNSLRIAALATLFTTALGIVAAYYAAKTPRIVKGALDCLFTLPLVLPPTVVGFFLLAGLGPASPPGAWLLRTARLRLVMTWYAAVLACIVVSFPLMYRTMRASFQSFNADIIAAGKTLGLSNTFIFWRILLPGCREGLLAGMVLSFARGLGEYGATSMVSGYIPGRTATISTTVYQLWREGNDALAWRWAAVNLVISFTVLAIVNWFESKHPEFVQHKVERHRHNHPHKTGKIR